MVLFKQRKPAEYVIVGIGDSIIEGKAATKGRDWLTLFASRLQEGGISPKLINAGEGGDNIIGVRRRLRRDCLRHRPKLVVLGTGVNDSRFRPSLRGPEVPLGRFRRTLEDSLRAIARGSHARVLVSGQVPVIDRLVDPYKDDKHYRRELQVQYERALVEVSAACGAVHFDNFDRWLQRGENFIFGHLADGLHPNDAGHFDIIEVTEGRPFALLLATFRTYKGVPHFCRAIEYLATHQPESAYSGEAERHFRRC